MDRDLVSTSLADPPQLDCVAEGSEHERTCWVLISGEYPPQRGGVSDYTRNIACGLSRAGDETHVFAPGHGAPLRTDSGVTVHPLPDHYGWRALAAMKDVLRTLPRNRRLLVQYVPQAFGWKGMNVPFCLWLLLRREPLWVMFHEVMYPLSRKQPLKHNILATVHKAMAYLAARRAERLFVSIPGWGDLLKGIAPRPHETQWLPVPSNFDSATDPALTASVRQRITGNREALLIGHFGTFGGPIANLLREALPELLLRQLHAHCYLIGSGSEEFAGELARGESRLRGRVTASGELPQEELSSHLSACDLMFQPYPDGVSSRRGSVMAGLAVGKAIVTTEGHLSEPLWRESGAVRLAPAGSPERLIDATRQLLADPAARERLGRRASELYRTRFTLDQTLARLRS